MIKTALHKRSSFFIDAINVVYYVDLFLYNELFYRASKGDQLIKSLFGHILPNDEYYYSGHGKDVAIIHRLTGKKHQNILLDLIDKSKYDLDIPLEEFVASLYFSCLTEPECPEFLQMTEFGNTLRMIVGDANVNQVVLYIPFQSDFILSTISESFSGVDISRLKILVGGKPDFLEKNFFDMYVLENVSDVDNLLYGKMSNRTEVLVPNYEFNLVEKRTNLEQLVEQVTYQRLNLKYDAREYYDKNLSINTMSIPL